MMTPKEQYSQIAPLADPDGFQLYWAARPWSRSTVSEMFRTNLHRKQR